MKNFEKEKQNIISDLTAKLCLHGKIELFSNIIGDIQALKATRPTCSSCEYYRKSDQLNWQPYCTNEKTEGIIGYIENGRNFGCIHHIDFEQVGNPDKLPTIENIAIDVVYDESSLKKIFKE